MINLHKLQRELLYFVYPGHLGCFHSKGCQIVHHSARKLPGVRNTFKMMDVVLRNWSNPTPRSLSAGQIAKMISNAICPAAGQIDTALFIYNPLPKVNYIEQYS